MNELLDPRPGKWILLVGPRNICPTMLTLTARLAGRGAVRVLDGGNQFNAYSVARAAGGRSEVLQRITVSRAFTCYQMLALLEATPGLSAPLVVLHLLSTFYDESIPAGERRRLLNCCIPHLHRLSRPAGSVVSVHPAAVPSTAALEFVEMLQAAAADVWYPPLPAPAPQPVRLF